MFLAHKYILRSTHMHNDTHTEGEEHGQRGRVMEPHRELRIKR